MVSYSRWWSLRRFGVQDGEVPPCASTATTQQWCRCSTGTLRGIHRSAISRDPSLCHQLRSLFFILARFEFDVVVRHTRRTPFLAITFRCSICRSREVCLLPLSYSRTWLWAFHQPGDRKTVGTAPIQRVLHGHSCHSGYIMPVCYIPSIPGRITFLNKGVFVCSASPPGCGSWFGPEIGDMASLG